jgi:hypothetical protein
LAAEPVFEARVFPLALGGDLEAGLRARVFLAGDCFVGFFLRPAADLGLVAVSFVLLVAIIQLG